MRDALIFGVYVGGGCTVLAVLLGKWFAGVGRTGRRR